MKVLIIGATGFIGRHVVEELLKRKHEVYVFTRDEKKAGRLFGDRVFIRQWETDESNLLLEYLERVQVVINLAGENLAGKRWSGDQKRKILLSRVEIGKALSIALNRSDNPPSLLIQSSAIAYYGFSEERSFTEESSNGEGFLPMVTRQWEGSVKDVPDDRTRKLFIRTGIVLGREGGLLPRMLKTFRYFMGGPLGSGKQWLSWIHIEDETEAIVTLAESEKLAGVCNLTAPNPVTMNEFARTLGQVMNKPSWFRVPGIVLKAVFGDMARETMLRGQKVLPARLQEMGFEFQHPHLKEAFRDLLNR